MENAVKLEEKRKNVKHCFFKLRSTKMLIVICNVDEVTSTYRLLHYLHG